MNRNNSFDPKFSLAPKDNSSAEAMNWQSREKPVAAEKEPPAGTSGERQADLDLARELFRQGNLPLAEIYARRCLACDAGDAEAAGLINELRRAYGMPADFVLSEAAPMSGDHRDRFLVIKAWGQGFWSEGHHLAGQLLLAELTQRTPVVLWGRNCLFRGDTDVDASGHFFDGLSPVLLEDIPRTATLFPGKWSWDNIHEEHVNKWEGDGSRMAAQYLFARPEMVLVSDFFSTIQSIMPWIGPTSKYFGKSEDELYAEMFQKYLKPTKHISVKVDAFFNHHIRGRRWVSVHVRGSDKVRESPSLSVTNAAYFDFINRIVEQNPNIGIFLLTDSLPMMDEYRKRYGDRVLCAEATRTSTDVGVHFSGHDGVALGEEVLIDTLLALKCDAFIGNQMSSVSLAIASMRNWPKDRICLLGMASARGENAFIHRRKQECNPKCRLCGALTNRAFFRLVMGKYKVAYYGCSGCGSLQTESPYWLEEAYSVRTDTFDTAKASRTVLNFLALRRLIDILGIRKDDRCADFCGGTGLFARLMRDIGYNFYNSDRSGESEYCAGFHLETFDRPLKLVTSFENAEPFTNPAVRWDGVFAATPDFILGSTNTYVGQGADWVDLSPESGRNNFFYSPEALAHVASRRGWEAYLLGSYFLLSRFPLSEQTLLEVGEWSRDPGSELMEGFQTWLENPAESAGIDNHHLQLLTRMRSAGARIGLDGTFFRYATGISRVWRALLAEWSTNGFGEFITVLDRGRTATRFAGITYVDVPPHSYADRLADRQMLQEICDRERITLFTSTYYTIPITTRAVLMVYDMIPENMGFNLEDDQWQEKHDAIKYCDRYLSISKSTTSDLIRFFQQINQEQVVTAHCGTDFHTPSLEAVAEFKARHDIDRPYFLISGVKTSYKNAILFFQAFAGLGEKRGDYAIVCTNSRPILEPEFAQCVGTAKVHLLVLSDNDLQCALAGALALAYPSRYEGFGLPILEAMACSCPVITCNNSSIAEVAGEAAIYVDPDDEPGMRTALHEVQQEAVRNQMLLKGHQRVNDFSWRRMADKIQSALVQWSTETFDH